MSTLREEVDKFRSEVDLRSLGEKADNLLWRQRAEIELLEEECKVLRTYVDPGTQIQVGEGVNVWTFYQDEQMTRAEMKPDGLIVFQKDYDPETKTFQPYFPISLATLVAITKQFIDAAHAKQEAGQ